MLFKKSIAVVLLISVLSLGFSEKSEVKCCECSCSSMIVPLLLFGGCAGLVLIAAILLGDDDFSVKINKTIDNKITFKDVKGLDQYLPEVLEIVHFVKESKKYKKTGAMRPKGVLLYGPPGCGKTLIAKAIAGESKAQIIAVSGSSFVHLYVGAGALNVRTLFGTARKLSQKSSVIIFIDEIDGLGIRNNGSKEYDSTINELLSQMDGMKKNENIIVIAATNKIQNVDPALIRPGRFDRKIRIPMPDCKAREEILGYYLSKINLPTFVSKEDVSKEFANRTKEFSPADLKNFVNEAAIFASREGLETVEKSSLEAALEKSLKKFVVSIKSQFYDQSKEDMTVRFSDVRGLKEVLIEVKEFVHILKNPDNYARLGATRPLGLMLYGPPGCGKTLTAKAIAGEAECHFIPVSGSDFVQRYVGDGAKKIKELFGAARKISKSIPVVLFIDEIDILGVRGDRHGVLDDVITEFLSQLDGFRGNENILVIAATNNLEKIDPALIRPGRFDRKVFVPLPGISDRKDILNYFLSKISLDEDLSCKELAEEFAPRARGFSGADLKNFVNEAAILAGRCKSEFVQRIDFEHALDKILLGPKNSDYRSKKESSLVAHHEAGHAVLARLFNFPVNKVSILPRGNSGGVTWIDLNHDGEINLFTRKELVHEIICLQGGYVAEEVVFGDVTPGAVNDLRNAGKLLYNMVNNFGMIKPLDGITRDSVTSELAAGKFDLATLSFNRKILQKTRFLVNKYKSTVEKVAQLLLAKETVTSVQLDEVIGEGVGAEVALDICAD